MTFIELLKKLEHRLGYHQLPINAYAKEIQDVFDSSPVHGELTFRVVREIYKVNNCRGISDTVDHSKTSDALIPIRLDILRSQKTDVDAFLFMDDICHAVKDILFLGLNYGEQRKPKRSSHAKKIQSEATIIDLDQYRHRKLKSWA